MAVFGLVRLDVIDTIRRERLAFVDDSFFYVVVKFHFNADGNAVRFHIAIAIVVFRFVRITQQRNFEISISIAIHQAHTACIALEHINNGGMNVICKHRVKSLIINFMDIDRLDVARERTCSKAIAARKRARKHRHDQSAKQARKILTAKHS